jgi:hypothetical protein
MSEMVERVAKEIAAEIMELRGHQRARFKFPDDANGDTVERARYAAELAIAAMREPTDGMLMAGCAGDQEGSFSKSRMDWRAMIDEALK